MFGLDGHPPSEEDITAYLTLISQVKEVIQGVHLYGLARLSLQPEASRLTRLSAEWLESMAQRIRLLGITVFVSP
jgi:metal-dependent hydrolase (beta-lactamase superfamily II)